LPRSSWHGALVARSHASGCRQQELFGDERDLRAEVLGGAGENQPGHACVVAHAGIDGPAAGARVVELAVQPFDAEADVPVLDEGAAVGQRRRDLEDIEIAGRIAARDLVARDLVEIHAREVQAEGGRGRTMRDRRRLHAHGADPLVVHEGELVRSTLARPAGFQ
jgi:hypothetical protein